MPEGEINYHRLPALFPVRMSKMTHQILCTAGMELTVTISPHYHTTFSRPAFSHDRRSLPYRLLLIASYNWLEVETLSSISYQRILDFHSTHHGTKHPTIDSARGSTQHDHNQFASSGFSRSGGNHGDTH